MHLAEASLAETSTTRPCPRSGGRAFFIAGPEMGLEDLVPDDKQSSSSSSSSRSRRSEPEEDTVVIGAGEYKKEFTEERWEEIKKTMLQEMGLVPNEVVNNYTAEERFEVIHEAALLSKQEVTLEELGREQHRCDICGNEMGGSDVEIPGTDLVCCVHHTAGQINKELDGD